MHLPDLINGLFEGSGGFMLARNVVQLYRHKTFKGVAIGPTAFFASWGYWNLYFYPHLDQWLSFLGGVGIVTANTIWAGQMLYYRRHPGGRAATRKADEQEAIYRTLEAGQNCVGCGSPLKYAPGIRLSYVLNDACDRADDQRPIRAQLWSDTDPETGKASSNEFIGPATAHGYDQEL